MQIPLNFEVHDKEPSKTNDHLQENKPRFSEQCQTIYDHLVEYGSITSTDAWILYGITRTASRIHDLKKNGVEFQDPPEWIQSGKTKVVNYKLK